MDISTYTLDDQVDIALHKIALSPNLTLTVNELYEVTTMDETTYRLDHFMLEKGLLKIVGESRSITGKGLEISNFGGWIAYRRLLRKENPRQVQSIEALQRKHHHELSKLRGDMEDLKRELTLRDEKEESNAEIIHNLLEQKRVTRVVVFVVGVVAGLMLSSVLWFLLF